MKANMFRLGITLFVMGFIILIIYGAMIGPLTDLTNTLTDTANRTMTPGTELNNLNDLERLIPTVLGVIAIIMFGGSAIAFYVNSIYKEPEEYDY